MKNVKKKINDEEELSLEWVDKEYKYFYPGKCFGLKRNKFGTSLNDYKKYFENLQLSI
mgnify:CR=1 FL=1